MSSGVNSSWSYCRCVRLAVCRVRFDEGCVSVAADFSGYALQDGHLLS